MSEYPATERHQREQRHAANQRRTARAQQTRVLMGQQDAQLQLLLGQQGLMAGQQDLMGQQNAQTGVFLGQQQTTLGQTVQTPVRPVTLGQRTSSVQTPVRPVHQPFDRSASRRLYLPREEKEDKANDEVAIVDAPNKDVNVLEIDDDGNFDSVEYAFTPAKSYGGYATFTPKDKSESSTPTPFPHSRDQALQQENTSLNGRVQALEQEKTRIEQEKAHLEQEMQQEKTRLKQEMQQEMEQEKKRLKQEMQRHLQKEKNRLQQETQNRMQAHGEETNRRIELIKHEKDGAIKWGTQVYNEAFHRISHLEQEKTDLVYEKTNLEQEKTNLVYAKTNLEQENARLSEKLRVAEAENKTLEESKTLDATKRCLCARCETLVQWETKEGPPRKRPRTW